MNFLTTMEEKKIIILFNEVFYHTNLVHEKDLICLNNQNFLFINKLLDFEIKIH